jgi:hypothetical protein
MPRVSPKLDIVAALYLGCVALCGITYTCLRLTPSSYGMVLSDIGAPERGPVVGIARSIREDEWAGSTPFFQAAVRNGFRRVNTSSFYQEDLRSFYLLPLKDWSLIFKPEVWLFFVASPATAFSFYYAFLMCAFLAGYFLLFRQMEIDSWLSASAAVMLYFSGFTQFWWTSFAPLLAGLPWILIVLFAPLRWWLKALLFSWVMPVVVLSFVYPTFFAEFAFAGIVLTLAVRPTLFRSPREWAALAIGGLVTGVVFYAYYQDLLPVMRNTWYPGRRIGLPGATPITVVLSQMFPFLTFSMRSYRNLAGANICESGAVGSFLPLLTLCLISPQVLRGNRPLRNASVVLAAAIALIITWQETPAPRWIGRLLLWDHGNAERLLFISGFLITAASLLIWRDKLVSPGRLRIALFVTAGPVLSLILKVAIFHVALAELHFDLTLCALGLVAGVLACLMPATARLPLLLGTITLMNVCAFGRFNPLQPAGPIFDVPETEVVRQLRQAEASTPGHFLLDQRFFGATLNGMGFRSVSHVLLAPRLAVFRKYFPAMDAARFDFVFNRYAYVNVTDDPVPEATDQWIIYVPMQAFEPIRNARTVILEGRSHKDWSIRRGGAIDRVSVQGNQLTIEGWAPWQGEDSTQGLRVISARALRASPLLTVKRPDISEAMTDYAYTRSGFRLQVSSIDGRPVRPEDMVVVARGTSHGDVLVTARPLPGPIF